MRPIRLFVLCSAAALLANCQEPTQPSSAASRPSARAGTPPKITITDLGTLPGHHYSVANGINAAGQVVGYSLSSVFAIGTNLDDRHAFLWEKGVMTDLGTLGGRSSEADAINARGQVVGRSATTGDLEVHAFRWEKGVMTDLGTLPGRNISSATGINDEGQVVGSSWDTRPGPPLSQAPPGAFLWDKGVMTEIGPISSATDINAAEQVVGQVNNHATLLKKGIVTDLGDFGGGSSNGYGINARGQVVGAARRFPELGEGEPELWRAFLWENGVMTDLGILGPSAAIGFSEAHDINAAGQVVGFSYVTERHGFLWEKGVMTDLGTLGGGSSEALGINAAGQIVGVSTTAGGDDHATLWTVK